MTEKKKYEAPQMKVRKFQIVTILAGSDTQHKTEKLTEEEYNW